MGQIKVEGLVPEEGVEPTQSKAPADFESAASASSATPGLLENSTTRRAAQHSQLALLGRASAVRKPETNNLQLPDNYKINPP